ncbi:MAG: hypothetical protein R2710_21670 [Acidimicrobiales bacterium]
MIGPPTNRPTFAGAVGNGSGSIGGIEPAQSDRRLTPIIPWFDDVLDDPFLSPSTWSDIALEPWRMVADGVADRCHRSIGMTSTSSSSECRPPPTSSE